MTAKWKQVLGSVAPMLGTAFGGPMGGMVAGMAAEALGLEPDASEKSIQKALAGPITDAQYTALHEADLAFQARCAELEVDLEVVHQRDRASARDMRVRMKDRTPDVLAFMIVGGFFATLYVLATQPLDPQAEKVLYAMVGVLGTMTVGVINFFFGSSSGSKKKTELLGGAAK